MCSWLVQKAAINTTARINSSKLNLTSATSKYLEQITSALLKIILVAWVLELHKKHKKLKQLRIKNTKREPKHAKLLIIDTCATKQITSALLKIYLLVADVQFSFVELILLSCAAHKFFSNNLEVRVNVH